jgi:NAD(P)-dependent dehydrogenase (short-subunit alcohol dehydrogenase family)
MFVRNSIPGVSQDDIKVYKPTSFNTFPDSHDTSNTDNTMSSLQNRVIAITGAASGIGLSTAHLLASHGAILSLADLNTSALELAEKEIKQNFPNTKILIFPLDVRSEPAVSSWIQSTISAFGALHGAANLAGVISRDIGIKGIEEQDVEEWDFVLDVNLKGVMLCMKYQLRELRQGGSVVNASSIAGVVSFFVDSKCI